MRSRNDRYNRCSFDSRKTQPALEDEALDPTKAVNDRVYSGAPRRRCQPQK